MAAFLRYSGENCFSRRMNKKEGASSAMKQLSAEILAIGTELLMGNTVNTNATYIARGLAQNGINVRRITP